MSKSSSYGLGLACFAIVAAVAGATQFTVGGANGWSVPAAAAEPFNNWAERTRFQVGDSLVFVYPKDQDSVLLVEPADYNACNTSSYVKRFDDGDTMVTLDRSGALFFISGVEANCRANEKLIVMVLAAGRNGTGGGGAPAPTTNAPPPASPSPPPASASTTPPPSSPAPKAASSPPPPSSASSAPPPASAAAPTTTPSTPPPASSPPTPRASSPAPVSTTPPPPSAPAGAPEPPPAPSASSPAPSAHGTTTANSTGTPSPPRPAGSKDKSGAGLAVASGLASSLGACVLGYAMLAL